MDLQRFNTLSLEQRTETVWEWGFLVARRKYENHTIAVFLIGDFFAEVKISHTGNRTEAITGKLRADLQGDIFSRIRNNPLVKVLAHDPSNAA